MHTGVKATSNFRAFPARQNLVH